MEKIISKVAAIGVAGGVFQIACEASKHTAVLPLHQVLAHWVGLLE